MDASRLATGALVGLALLIAGCGGDDGDGGDSLTKAEYQKEGNALCREAFAKVRDIDEPTSPEEIPDYVDRLFDLSFSYTDEFEALEPPDELKDAHDESVRLSEDSKEQTDELVERLREAENPPAAAQREFQELLRSPEFKRSLEVTRKLGLDACLELGAPGAEQPEAS